MQIDFSRDELDALHFAITMLSHRSPTIDELSRKLGLLRFPMTKVDGVFNWRDPTGGHQYSNARVLIDGQLVDEVAIADTQAGLLVTQSGEIREGRVEVWVP